jgi:hypothetical protein
MSESNTTLGQWASVDIPVTAREYIRRQAEVAREALGKDGREHVAGLEALADYIAGCSPQDPRMWTLAIIAAIYGDRDRFHGGGKMTGELLSRLAGEWEVAAPHQDVTLSELIGAQVSDLIEHLGSRVGEAVKAAELAQNEVRELREQAALGLAADAELKELRELVNVLTAEKGEVEHKLEYVRAHYGPQAEAEERARKKAARRRRVEGEGLTGIYVVDTPDGEVYEIGFHDADKRQRWKRVGPDLEEAIELRKELAGKPYEPEAVAA